MFDLLKIRRYRNIRKAVWNSNVSDAELIKAGFLYSPTTVSIKELNRVMILAAMTILKNRKK